MSTKIFTGFRVNTSNFKSIKQKVEVFRPFIDAESRLLWEQFKSGYADSVEAYRAWRERYEMGPKRGGA